MFILGSQRGLAQIEDPSHPEITLCRGTFVNGCIINPDGDDEDDEGKSCWNWDSRL